MTKQSHFYSLLMLAILSSCLSTDIARDKLIAYDKKVVKRHSEAALPVCVNLQFQNHLPENSSVKGTYFMALPLIVVNYFQANHKVTLGNSSMTTPTEELFRKKFAAEMDRLPWSALCENKFALDIVVEKIEVAGLHVSGFAGVFGAGQTGDMGSLRKTKWARSTIRFSYQFKTFETSLESNTLTLSAKANKGGEIEVKYVDSLTGDSGWLPAQEGNRVGEDVFEDAIASAEEVYGLSISTMARFIVDRAENRLTELYSINK